MKHMVIVVALIFATVSTLNGEDTALSGVIDKYKDVAKAMADTMVKAVETKNDQLNSIMQLVGKNPDTLITKSAMRELLKDHSLKSEKAGTRSISVQADQGFNGFTNYQPSGWKVTETVGEKTGNPISRTDEKVPVYIYPKGVGAAIINSCTDSDYSKTSPCYTSKVLGTGKVSCPNLMDSTAYIGVGFDGRGFYKIESRRASLVQRACANMATFMGKDVPDNMNVFGIFETTAETKSFQSADEYVNYIREKAGQSSQNNLFMSEANEYKKSTGVAMNMAAVGTVIGGLFGAKYGGPEGAAQGMKAGSGVGKAVNAEIGSGSGGSNSNEDGNSHSSYSDKNKATTKQAASNNFFAIMYVNIILYDISLDDVKAQDINFAALKDYMNLPASFYSVGADVKYQNFLIRWGTHFIRSAKFGGQLKITKTAKANRAQSIDEFSSIAETEFQAMFASLQSKYAQSSIGLSNLLFSVKSSSSSQSSSADSRNEHKSTISQKNNFLRDFRQSEFTNTVVEAQGGTPRIAEALIDFYTPAFRQLYHDWVVSINDYTKPFEFQLRTIDQLFHMNMDAIFSSEDDLNFGCMGAAGIPITILTDSKSQRYYIDVRTSFFNNKTTVMQKKVYCKYNSIEDFKVDLERRRISLEKAVAVYMAEGPFPTSSYVLDAGQPGCEEATLAQFKLFEKSSQPLLFSELKKTPFLILFDLPQEIPNLLTKQAKYIMLYRDDRWYATEPRNQLFHLYDGCSLIMYFEHSKSHDIDKICIFNIILTYMEKTGYFYIDPIDFDISKQRIPELPSWLSGSNVARASRLHSANDTTDDSRSNRAAVPCNVKWLNSHRMDPGRETNCIHFTSASEGDLFVIFSSIPRDHTTWYYLEINKDGVAYYQAMRLQKREVEKGMGILGDKNLYQTMFVCVRQRKDRVMIQYGKASDDSEVGTVYSSYTFARDSQYSRLSFYAFGSGSNTVSLMDIRLTRQMPKVDCLNTNYIKHEGHCILNCHRECIDCNMAHNDKSCFHCVNVRVESDYVAGSSGSKVTQCVPQCPDRYQLSGTANGLCVKCPVGEFKEKPGNQKCVPCAKGMFSNSTGSLSCTKCPPRTFSSQTGSSQCQECPQGTSNKENGATKCRECAPGTFAGTGQLECNLCPIGQFTSMTGQAKCLPCSVGYFAATHGQSTCTVCPAGTSSTEGSMSCANNCTKGMFSPSHGIHCRMCAPGTYAESAGSSSCAACESGSYQPSGGQAACIVAPIGSYAVGPGATSFSLCPAGSANALSGQGSPPACIPCAAGSFSNTPGSSTCTPCPKGRYQPSANQTACLDASPGSYADVEGLASKKACPMGQFSGTNAAVVCTSCPAGSYTGKTESTKCNQCSSGSWSKSGAADCALCKAGSYSSYPGSDLCTPCPAGNYSNIGSASCTSCPAGNYSNNVGSASCTPCPAGKYSNNAGSTSCTDCTAGYYSSTGSASCTICHQGHYSDAGSSRCIPCSAGRYTSASGSTTCKQCSAGQYSFEGSNGCTWCPAGLFSTYASATCDNCPPGTYSSTGSAHCTSCPAGMHSYGSGSTSCTGCPAGQYSNNVGSAYCNTCPANHYSSYGSTYCTKCSDGQTSTLGSASCTDRPTVLLPIKMCKQSSNSASSYTCDKAIDDNTDGDYDHGSCSVTGGEHGWWVGGFDMLAFIRFVRIYNRQDNYQERLTNFVLRVGDASITYQSVAFTQKDFHCDRVGRGVSIHSNLIHLTLCEVQLWGNFMD